MTAQTQPGILFDIDGTLVDSNYLHTIAWFRAFDSVGYRVPMARIHRAIGMGSDKLIPSLIGDDADPKNADELHGEHYRQLHDELRAFDRAGDLLRACKERGARVVLATSAKERDLEALTRAIDADDAIDEITSSDDVDESKPDPDIFQAAMQKAGLDPHETIVVGDTKWDVEAARRSGLDTVAVLTGGWSRQELGDAGAVAVYDDVADLLANLDASPLGDRLRDAV
ncbi:MAG TPA: HAD family hydrolase [Acidimicrobiales bacterium]|nr:HAD family hydrolase [Acidimicrobiales bacterium]